jgi:hypothetical protein
MTWRPETTRRIALRVSELIEDFDGYCDAFDRANLFTGPSAHFHSKSLAILRKHNSISDAILDESFLEAVYATLTSWGMHRMGPGNTKLVDFREFVVSFVVLRPRIQTLSEFTLLGLKSGEIADVSEQLWSVISEIKIGRGATRIVSGSKVLHHLFPELIPPIDREYTIRFFFHHKNMNRGDKAAFQEMYPHFHLIASKCSRKIESRLGKGMNTSTTKVLDNAIVGYVITRFKTEVGIKDVV